MKHSFYAIFNKNGYVRGTKKEGVVRKGELQAQVNLTIPNKAFSQPQFVANLTITEDQLPDIIQEFEIELLRLKEGEETEVL